jgi:hypothetical protein
VAQTSFETPRKFPFFQDDNPQSPQRLIDFVFFQQAERCPYVGAARSVRKKHSSWKRKDTTLESLGLDDTRRIAFLTEQKLEPGHGLLEIFTSRDRQESTPEKHSSLWGIPLCDVKEVTPHGSLEHITLCPIELSNLLDVSKKALSPP